MKPLFSLTLGLGLVAQALGATPAPDYPSTPERVVLDRYHGVTVADPYRWMEDMKSPEFQQWLKAQAVFTEAGLKTLSGREALRKRLGELARRCARASRSTGRSLPPA